MLDNLVLGKSTPNNENFDTLIFCFRDAERVLVPDSIEIIKSNSFNKCNNLKYVDFTQNSKLRIIDKYSFFICSIQRITIPPNLVKINEGWVAGTNFLNEINVLPNNPNFMCYNNQFLLGKSDPEKANFDVLIFSVRNIKKAIIPSFIEIISDNAFANCTELKKIEFSPDSKLRKIYQDSFIFTKIKKITLPPHLTVWIFIE